MKKYIRSERANLFEPNDYISMIVKLSGDLQSEEIEQAVYKAYEANEATMSKIVLEDNGDVFYEKTEVCGCKFFLDSRSWKELLYQSEKKPFALNEGELVRTFFTEENKQAVLFIHAHHLVGDGQAVLILLDDIVSSLDKQLLTYKPMLSVERKFLEKRAKLDTGVKLYIGWMNQKWQKNARVFTWDDYYRVHKKYWDKYVSEIEWKSYNVKELKVRCPKGITINSYMIAELLREFSEYEVVGIPVSIREDEGMSNQTSGIAVKYKYNYKSGFEVNANRVHKAIYKKLNNKNMKYFILLFMERLCPSLIDAVLLQSHGCYQNKLTEKMAKIMGYIGDGGRDLGVTNLNKIDIPNVHERFVIKDILFVPPKVSYAKEVIGISTYADKLTVCYHKMNKRKYKEKVRNTREDLNFHPHIYKKVNPS